MARSLDTALHRAPPTDESSSLVRALALCSAVLAGTPARLAALRRLDRLSDADLAREGRTRDAEIRRTFADLFGF